MLFNNTISLFRLLADSTLTRGDHSWTWKGWHPVFHPICPNANDVVIVVSTSICMKYRSEKLTETFLDFSALLFQHGWKDILRTVFFSLGRSSLLVGWRACAELTELISRNLPSLIYPKIYFRITPYCTMKAESNEHIYCRILSGQPAAVSKLMRFTKAEQWHRDTHSYCCVLQ